MLPMPLTFRNFSSKDKAWVSPSRWGLGRSSYQHEEVCGRRWDFDNPRCSSYPDVAGWRFEIGQVRSRVRGFDSRIRNRAPGTVAGSGAVGVRGGRSETDESIGNACCRKPLDRRRYCKTSPGNQVRTLERTRSTGRPRRLTRSRSA